MPQNISSSPNKVVVEREKHCDNIEMMLPLSVCTVYTQEEANIYMSLDYC